MDRILPTKAGYLTSVTRDLQPGEYVAEVVVSYAQQELVRQEMPLVIGKLESQARDGRLIPDFPGDMTYVAPPNGFEDKLSQACSNSGRKNH